MLMHCGTKPGSWLVGSTTLLLLLATADTRWHKLHRNCARHYDEPNDDDNGYEENGIDEYPMHRDGSAATDYADYAQESVQRVPPRHRALLGHKLHRRRQQRQQRQHRLPPAPTSQFGDSEEPAKLARLAAQRHRSRGKRLSQRRHWTEKDKESFSHRPLLQLDNERRDYELEVREAQNSSLCNYTVIPILDPGGRIPRDLEHVKCNHAGSRCQDKGTYCCIQTYRNVEVVYETGNTEMMKVYSGCVCSLQIYGTLEPYTPNLEIND